MGIWTTRVIKASGTYVHALFFHSKVCSESVICLRKMKRVTCIILGFEYLVSLFRHPMRYRCIVTIFAAILKWLSMFWLRSANLHSKITLFLSTFVFLPPWWFFVETNFWSCHVRGIPTFFIMNSIGHYCPCVNCLFG